MNYYNLINNLYKKFGIEYNQFFLKTIFLSLFSALIELLGIGSLIFLISSISSAETYALFVQKFSDYLEINIVTVKTYLSINNLIFFSILFYSIRFFLLIFKEYLISKYIGQIKRKLSLSILRKNLLSEYTFILNQEKNNLIRNIYIEAERFIGISINYIRLLSELVLLSFLIVGLIFINANFMIFMIIFLLVIFIIHSLFIKKFLIAIGRERSFYEKKVFDNVQNVVSGFKEIRVNNIADRFLKIFEKNFTLLTHKIVKVLFLNGVVRPIIEFIFILGILFFIMYTVYFSSSPMTELIVFSLAVIRIYPSVNKIINYRTSIYVPHAAITYLEEVAKIKQTYEYDPKMNKLNFNKDISLKNIYFRYWNTNNNILQNINICIKKNSVFLISGKSGVGKTTLINILMGLLKPTKGQILIDDKIEIKNSSDWTNQISYVSQNFFVFDASLENNITLFQETNIDKKMYEYAIDLSMSKDLEKKFTKNIEVNRKDNVFSGGEKQRISLARAIYFNKSILILDEPTSMLDAHNRDRFLNTLNILKKTKTIIIISHDESVKNFVDDMINL